MFMRPLIVFIALIVASGVIARAERVERVPIRQPFTTFPMSFGEWRGRNNPPLSEQEAKILGADDYLTRTYFAPGRSTGLYVSYWETQKRGDTVHSPLNCLPGAGWEPVSKKPLRIAVAGSDGASSDIQVNRYIIQKGLDRLLVLYWYQSHGRVVDSEYWGKFYLVSDAVRLGRSDTAIVRVTTVIADTSEAAEARAEKNATEFVQRLFPSLDEYLPS